MSENIKSEEIKITEQENGEVELLLNVSTSLYESLKEEAKEKQMSVDELIKQELVQYITDQENFVESLHKEINDQLNEEI